jgi:hypothetical protein
MLCLSSGGTRTMKTTKRIILSLSRRQALTLRNLSVCDVTVPTAIERVARDADLARRVEKLFPKLHRTLGVALHS